jgi:hypothetical protein
MIVIGIILLVIGVLAKIGIVWTTGFVILIPGLIALLLGMTGHGIGGRRARRRHAAPARRRGFPTSRPWRTSSPRRRGTPSATTGFRFGPPRRGSGRHRSCSLRERRGRQGAGRKGPLVTSAKTCSTMAWARCCPSAWIERRIGERRVVPPDREQRSASPTWAGHTTARQ